MTVTDYISKNSDNLPTVRISRVTMRDFRNVGYGQVTFSRGLWQSRYESEADILGVFGQNGSGKTAFIEAVSIMRELVRGASLPGAYLDCVAVDREYAWLEFVHDLQYKDGTICTVSYSFRLGKTRELPEDKRCGDDHDPTDYGIQYYGYRPAVSDEILSASVDGQREQIIPDTFTEDMPYCPGTERKGAYAAGTKRSGWRGLNSWRTGDPALLYSCSTRWICS